MKDKTLVILTTHFGSNFSGGSRATAEIFSRLDSEFDEIHVICNRIGDHNFSNIRFTVYRNMLHALMILLRLSRSDHIFYGDFYNSIWFALTNRPFYFTYHDNWPKLANTSLSSWLRSLFYIPAYRVIFRRAKMVFTVSEGNMDYIRRYNPKVFLIRNGFAVDRISGSIIERRNVLMVGNITHRKYRHALRLFRTMKRKPGFEVHIYGNLVNKSIARRLQAFPFVKLMGFVDPVPYGRYRLMVHTSAMENLPLTFCEALNNQVPVITFNVGSVREVIHNGNGVLIKPYSVEDMKNKMNSMMNDTETWGHFDQTILKNYSWENAKNSYLQLMSS